MDRGEKPILISTTNTPARLRWSHVALLLQLIKRSSDISLEPRGRGPYRRSQLSWMAFLHVNEAVKFTGFPHVSRLFFSPSSLVCSSLSLGVWNFVLFSLKYAVGWGLNYISPELSGRHQLHQCAVDMFAREISSCATSAYVVSAAQHRFTLFKCHQNISAFHKNTRNLLLHCKIDEKETSNLCS